MAALLLLRQRAERHQYSDVAYYLLSRVVEKASGVTMEAFIRRELHVHARSDMVKLGYMLSCGGVYNGVRVLREETIRAMMERGYALHHPEDSDFYLKTGAYGQIIVFSATRPFAAAGLSELDVGEWFSPEYTGEHIPTLAQSLDLMRRAGILCKSDNVWERFTPLHQEILFGLVDRTVHLHWQRKSVNTAINWAFGAWMTRRIVRPHSAMPPT